MSKTATFLNSRSPEGALEIASFARSVPAYAREFAGLEITLDGWTSLPLLSKEILIDAVEPGRPYGDRLGVGTNEIAWCFVAPGPMFVPLTTHDTDALAERFADTMRMGGFTSADVVDQTTLYNWVIAGSILGKGLEKVGATVVPGGAGDTQRHIDVIEQLGVTAILAFPTFLVHLLDTAREQGRTLPLKRAMVMGELHDPREKDRIFREYGVVVREFYGTGDVGPVAVECGSGSGMHVRDDVYVELVDPNTGESVSSTSPDRPAELVVTDPERRALPIIRLRTGDLIDTLATEPCTCGRTSPRIGRIVGRVGDITKVKGMFVVPGSVKTVFRRHDFEARYQLVVSRTDGRDELALRVEGNEPSAWAKILEDVNQALRVRCASEFVTTIEGDNLLVDRREVV